MISTEPYVVRTIIETFFMVEFGLFREKKVDRSLRKYLMALPAYESFDFD